MFEIPSETTDSELIAQIIMLYSSAYQNLSRFHAEALDEMEIEAARRGIKITLTAPPTAGF